jgi:alginate O-acetyltransferase complex protein AlgI
MLFCSWTFARFFALVFAVYWLLPWRRVRFSARLPGGGPRLTVTGDEVRLWWLTGASFWFYASWSRRLALLICVTTLLDYGIGLGLELISRPRLRRCLLLTSIAANLGMLVTFKYANFFLDSLQAALQGAGVHSSLPVLRILVPVGISFYTFEAINYTVEVYRRRVRAERNPVHLLFFILFFPHLISGPIVRARDFLPQIRRRKRWSWPRCQLGIEYFLLGVLKKVVVADQLAVYADPVFAAPGAFGTAANWLALLAFTLQVYCDISGYSDMAVGLAHLLGYKLARNFDMPYVATSITDYWRRDHISLSSWLRDYLFIPMGGSRGSTRQTCRNFMITMTLGGLWHGASWNFVLWGALHGVFLSVHRAFRSFCTARPRLDRLVQTPAGTALRRLLTFFCVCQGFVLFRAIGLGTATTMLGRLWLPAAGLSNWHPFGMSFFWCLIAGAAVFHVAGYCGWWTRLRTRVPAPVLGCGLALLLVACMAVAPLDARPFIYFQF